MTAISWLRGDTDRPLGVTVTCGAVYRHPAILAVELTARPACQVLKVTRLTASSMTSSRWLTATLTLLYRPVTSSDWLTATLTLLYRPGMSSDWLTDTQLTYLYMPVTSSDWLTVTLTLLYRLVTLSDWLTATLTLLYRLVTVSDWLTVTHTLLCRPVTSSDWQQHSAVGVTDHCSYWSVTELWCPVCRHCSEMLPGWVQTL